MGMTDPVADMLARINNAMRAAKEAVDIPPSKMKRSIARLLKEEGYIEDFEVVGDGVQRLLRLKLKYTPERESAIAGLKRISRPGLRVYAKAEALPKVLGGMGTAILSTSAGLMTDKEAHRHHLGGEVVAFIW